MDFIKVKDLFARDNVECPEWLDDYLEDDWMNSIYSFKDNVHKWHLQDPFKNVLISFDGNEYMFQGFDDEGNVIMEHIITPEYVLMT